MGRPYEPHLHVALGPHGHHMEPTLPRCPHRPPDPKPLISKSFARGAEKLESSFHSRVMRSYQFNLLVFNNYELLATGSNTLRWIQRMRAQLHRTDPRLPNLLQMTTLTLAVNSLTHFLCCGLLDSIRLSLDFLIIAKSSFAKPYDNISHF